MKQINSSIEVLSEKEVQLIHDSSVNILETIGINVPNQEVLKRCEAYGAVIDYDKEIMKLPRKALEDVLDTLKTMNKENFEAEMKKHDISAHISTQVFFTDYKTKTCRYGLRDDNLKGFALLEKLDNFPCADPVVVPSDVPDQISDVIGFQDIYKYSTKPGATYILTPTSAKYIIEMNKLMNKPCGYLLETISPLSYKKDTLEMALLFAENGGGLGVGPMAMSGATAPVTVAGTIALENAEILASMFIVYVLTGKISGYSSPVHSMDMKTMLCSFGSPNQALFAVAMAQMSRFYGISAMTNAGLTDALMPDFQAGIEKGITACFNYLAGCRSMGAMGIVGADQGISLEQLVLDNEWISYYNYIISGFEVSPDTIGLDAIHEVGIKGNFLDNDHTLDYWQESYLQSKIFLRDNFANWTKASQPELLDRAHAFVESATAGYKDRQPVISQSLCDELDRIVDDAVKEVMDK
ncbi:MAG: trimethylamine methyltransferase family protein [Clostridiales bacterium]|nr:trimethylamine methyltransferase family protein [Clostridiales bacterium]MDY3747694.1 trimethylamine methyltransferase family protein [Lachnospiraceae bacterium]